MPGDTDKRYSPRGDVTIVRDKGFGVPHVYGRTRNGTMFGAGYTGAEDRLFLMDVLRHTGRAELSEFLGGSAGNLAMDREQWTIAPYDEADLQLQFDRADELYGERGRQIQRDVNNYVAGINKYIREAKGQEPKPTLGSKNGETPAQKLPGEYGVVNQAAGNPGQPEPEPWKATDVIATASLVGGIFGKGGGRELDSALILQAAETRFGGKGRGALGRLPPRGGPRGPGHGRRRVPVLAARRDSETVEHGDARQGDGQEGQPGRREHGAPGRRGRDRTRGDRSARWRLQRTTGLGQGVAVRSAGLRLRPSDRLLHAPAADGAGPPRPEDRRGTGDRRTRVDLRRRKPLHPARSRPRLRLERDLGRPGHRRHLRARAVRARRAERPVLPLPRPVPADREGPPQQHLALDARLPVPAGQRDALHRSHEARARRGPGDAQGQAGDLRRIALDLLPRGRLGDRLLRLQQPRPGQERVDLPEGGEPDRLHLQLVLRRQGRHHLLQLGQQPRAGARDRHQLPGPRLPAGLHARPLRVRVEGLEPRRTSPPTTRRSPSTRARPTRARAT